MADPFIAQIMMFGGNFAPRGWAFCNGQLLSIAQNTALFSILGTTYGGNGQTTFALPNLQSRVPMHWGQGPGLSPVVLGQTAGTETTTLTIPQMPAHNHAATTTTTVNALNAKATQQEPTAGALLGRPTDGSPTPTSVPRIYVPSGTGDTALGGVSSTTTVGIQGGSQPFSIIQPYQARQLHHSA